MAMGDLGIAMRGSLTSQQSVRLPMEDGSQSDNYEILNSARSVSRQEWIEMTCETYNIFEASRKGPESEMVRHGSFHIRTEPNCSELGTTGIPMQCAVCLQCRIGRVSKNMSVFRINVLHPWSICWHPVTPVQCTHPTTAAIQLWLHKIHYRCMCVLYCTSLHPGQRDTTLQRGQAS